MLGLILREWRERKDVPPLVSVTDSKGNYDHLHNETIGPSEDRRSAIDLALFGQTYPDHRYSCGGLVERRKWQTP